MNEKYNDFAKYPDDVRIYDYENIPVESDLFILGADDFTYNIPKWIDYISGDHTEHPNAYINYIHGYCKFTPDGVLDSFTEINIYDRFHGICKKILRKDFVFCFQYYSCGEKPFIIVKQNWFDSLKSDSYSTYGMIDIIGIKKYLYENGKIGKELIEKYKTGIDQISSQNVNYSFVTFTDNIFIKSNWESTQPNYGNKYQPEHFLRVIKSLQNLIEDVFKMKSYAVITQGIQLFDYDEEIISCKNHYFIGSIATPFIELFDIDESLKKIKKEKPYFLNNLYLSEAFLLSLKLTTLGDKKDLGHSSEYLLNNSGVSMDSFFSLDIDDIIDILK